MGIDDTFGKAFLKAQISANQRLPKEGTVFVSLNDQTKEAGVGPAKGFQELGFKILATEGTAAFLEKNGVKVEQVLKLHEGRPHAGERHIPSPSLCHCVAVSLCCCVPASLCHCAAFLERSRVKVEQVLKLHEERPHAGVRPVHESTGSTVSRTLHKSTFLTNSPLSPVVCSSGDLPSNGEIQ